MSPIQKPPETQVGLLLDQLAAEPAVRSNCMFQLALMLARIAVEPCAESYKDAAAQSILELIRGKPTSNVVRLFDAAAAENGAGPGVPPPFRRSGSR